MAWRSHHDVALVIRRDHRGSGDASVRDALDCCRRGVRDSAVVEYPLSAGGKSSAHGSRTSYTRTCAAARGTSRSSDPRPCTCAPCTCRSTGRTTCSPTACSASPSGNWARAGSYRGRAFLLPNSLVPQPKLSPTGFASCGEAWAWATGISSWRRRSAGVPEGFDLLIRAFEQAGLPNGRLVIAGDGSERRGLERMAGDRVNLVGFRHDVKDLYQAFDVFVCPSSYEPFGRSSSRPSTAVCR